METCRTVLFGLTEVTWGAMEGDWGSGRLGSWCRTEKVWDDLVLVILLKKQVSLLFKNSNTQKQKEEYHEPHVPITQIQQLLTYG